MTEEIKKKIEDKVESYSFQVPYNGTNDFYNETKAKSFTDGAEYGYSLAADRIKELEDAVKNTTEIAANMLTKVSMRAEELEELVRFFTTITATVHFPNADKQHEYNAKLREAKALLPPAPETKGGEND